MPHTAFNHKSAGVPFSAIMNDVTLVPQQQHVLSVLDFILQDAMHHTQFTQCFKRQHAEFQGARVVLDG